MPRRVIRSTARAIALGLGVAGAALSAAGEERVRLVPEGAPPWRASRVLEALRDGARAARDLRIETAPAGARLELAYLRDGGELARAEGFAPLVATLPGHALTGDRDRVRVRAELAGFAPSEVVVDARGAAPRVQIQLEPLLGRIQALSLLELGGHARFALVSDKELDARLVATERGWRLVLAHASLDGTLPARLDAMHGAVITGASVRPVGSDLFFELTRAPSEHREPRLLRFVETARAAHHLALEWLPTDRRASSSLAVAERRLASSANVLLAECVDRFARALTAAIGQGTLARSLAPNGSFTDAYVALALEQLAAHSPRHELVLRDGTRIALASGAARAVAHSRAAEVRGALAAVRALAEQLAPPGGAERALHAWIAPDLAFEDFAAAYASSVRAEASCGERSP